MGSINIFKKGAEAAPSGGGNFIRDGIYKFVVEKCLTKSGKNGDCFIAEFRVLEAAPDLSYPEVKPNPVGTTCSVVLNFTKHDSAASNLKALAIGVLGGLGYVEAQIDEALMTEMAAAANPMRGVVVGDITYRSTIKGGANAGKAITLHKWQIVEQTVDEVKAQRAKLDKTEAAAVADKPAETTAPASSKLSAMLGAQ